MSDNRDDIINYISERYAAEDTLLKNILIKQLAGGGPMMNIGPDQGKFLYLLVQLLKAKNILELGSYYGYSSIWLARAIRELNKEGIKSHLTCIERSADYADLVQEHLAADDLRQFSTVITGSGLEVLTKLINDKQRFDMIFIDADKANYPNYLDLAALLLPQGGCLLVDNTLWSNKVLDNDTADKQTQAIQEFNDKLAQSTDFEATLLTIQDGLTLALRK